MPAPLTLEPIIEGNPDGETIVFVQGWPDDASLWDATVAELREAYRCVRVNMPNFGPERKRVRWGYSTEEIVDALVALLRKVAGDGKVTLVLHDWGSYWGHAAHHRAPEVVARVATLDVAPHFTPKPREWAGLVAYQGLLLSAFYIGGPVGDALTRGFAKLAKAPQAATVEATMNYPYRNAWSDIASGRIRTLTKGYFPDCPLLFVYGEQKPFAFHSERWLAHVRATGGSVVALPCDHWVPRHPTFPTLLASWLAEHPEGATKESAQRARA
ncbi:MAG: alpha/beta fold hydrolase [Polyangiaceae bacterium]